MGGENYETVQKDAFAKLVTEGVYSESFGHAPQAQKFFAGVMTEVLRKFEEQSGISVLDCGCGNGAWLDILSSLDSNEIISGLYGFDLTPEMVEVARMRIVETSSAVYLQEGNILEPESYHFEERKAEFDLIFTYDVVQQLPRKLQFVACETILRHLTSGGVAVIFDSDCHSPFGRQMARKKFFTRYFGLKLVPRYYCNAHYPPLTQFSHRIAQLSEYSTEMHIAENNNKRALIIRSSYD